MQATAIPSARPRPTPSGAARPDRAIVDANACIVRLAVVFPVKLAEPGATPQVIFGDEVRQVRATATLEPAGPPSATGIVIVWPDATEGFLPRTLREKSFTVTVSGTALLNEDNWLPRPIYPATTRYEPAGSSDPGKVALPDIVGTPLMTLQPTGTNPNDAPLMYKASSPGPRKQPYWFDAATVVTLNVTLPELLTVELLAERVVDVEVAVKPAAPYTIADG